LKAQDFTILTTKRGWLTGVMRLDEMRCAVTDDREPDRIAIQAAVGIGALERVARVRGGADAAI